MASIKGGGTYRIFTMVEGTKYYLASNGALTSDMAGSCIFALKVTSGGALYDEGIKIVEGHKRYFSNPTLSDGKANLKPGTGVFRLDDGGNDRNDWERQVFYLNQEGNYAIRSCNTTYGESDWEDAGRTFWTYEIKDANPDPCYTYEAAFIWNLERASTYDFDHNGIYYNIIGDNEVEVTYVEPGEGNCDFYYGDITIPPRVSKNSVTYDVTAIGKDAFHYCSNVTSVTIPSSVTSIGYDAFSECSGLTSIIIPSSVTIIDEWAFHLCSGLTSVTLNEGLRVIMDNAFNGCTSLTEITIPSSVELLRGHAFGWCTGLTSATLLGKPSQHFSNIAFLGCDNLTTFRCDGITLEPVDGVYRIGTAEELRDFAILTTAANCKLNACLTADIDYTVYVNGDKWINMGMNGYAGTFDGQGHTITINYYNIGYSWNTESGALFNKIYGGTVKNLRVAGRIENDAKYSAGIVSILKSGTVSHCVSDVDIVSHIDGDCTDGGIVALTMYDGKESVVEHCVVAGSFQGNKAHHRGGIIGIGYGGNSEHIIIDDCLFLASVDGLDMTESNTFVRDPIATTQITNCYYLNKLGTTSTGIQTNQEELASGELCWMLNGESSENPHWFQTLGTDAYPVPFNTHRTVYAEGNGFVNTQTFNIAKAQDLIDFAARVNSGETDICARLTADINLSGKTYTAIGTRDNPFVGTFDGQGHKISNLHIDVEADNQGLIGVAGDGATIKNVTMDKTCSIKATRYAAGIVGATYTSGTLTIENCGNEASVTCLRENAAGIYGSNIGYYTTIVIRNSYNAGTITGGWESAAISGWVGGSSTITNSYNTGEVTGLDGTNTFYRGIATIDNCYETIGSQVAQVTASDVTSGRLCWLLSGGNTENPVWRQNLSEANSHPVPNVKGRIVYKDGSSYYNEPDKNYLQMAATQVRPGGSTILSISLTNEASITAMQFELSLPDGVSVSSAGMTNRNNGHSIDFAQLANGNYQFTVFSSSSKALIGNEGAIINVTLNAASGMSLGDYTVRLTNIELTTLGAEAVYPMDYASTLTLTNSIRLGDVNDDDKITITDAVGIVNHILGNASSNFHPEAADVNGDGGISITDAVKIVNIILNQGSGVKERRTQEVVDEKEPQ